LSEVLDQLDVKRFADRADLDGVIVPTADERLSRFRSRRCRWFTATRSLQG
jgi:hypothetical protein